MSVKVEENSNVGSTDTNEDFRKENNSRKGRNSGRWNRGPRNRELNESQTENQDCENNGEFGHEGDHRKRYAMNYSDRVEQYISQLSFKNTLELPPLDLSEKKFSGKNRIYIGNFGGEDMNEEDLTTLFQPYGETSEIFMNKAKNFAFIKMDFHANAIKARQELDGITLKSRTLRMKISPSTATVKVKNLVPSITSELLYYAFWPFGEIENATVCVDDRGRSTGEGIIDFVRKNSALQAIQKCRDKCYFLSYSLKPVVVEPYESTDQSVGLLDKHFSKRNNEFAQERSVGPRIARLDSFEHEYGARWKSLFELYKQKEEALRVEFRLECEKLEAQQEYARFEHETETLREQLRVRELDKERQKREWENKQRQAEEERLKSEALMRQTEEDIQNRMRRQHDEMRRRQEEETNLLMQAQNLSSILDTQEHLDGDAPSSSTRGEGMVTYDSYYNAPRGGILGSGPGSSDNSWNKSSDGGRWVREEVYDRGFQTKRRRF